MLNITFRNLDSSQTIHALAAELLAKLTRAHGEAVRAHLVLADTLGAHAHCDKRFAAHLELSLGTLSMQSQSTHGDAALAVREAFERVERQLTRAAGRRSSQKRAERA